MIAKAWMLSDGTVLLKKGYLSVLLRSELVDK